MNRSDFISHNGRTTLLKHFSKLFYLEKCLSKVVLPWTSAFSNPPKFKREVKKHLLDLAKKNFNYKSYPYGWTVFEGNQIQAPLGTY